MSAIGASDAAGTAAAAPAAAPAADELAPAEWEILVRGVETAVNDAALSAHPALRDAFTSASDGFVPVSVLSTLAPNAAVLRSHAEANLVEAARRSGVLTVNAEGTMFKRRHPFDRTAALGYPVIAVSPIPKSATWSGIKGAVLASLRRARQTGTVRVMAQKCPSCRVKAARRAAAKAAAAAAAKEGKTDAAAAGSGAGDSNGAAAASTAGDESKTVPAAAPAPCTCGQVAFVVVLNGTIRHGGDLVATLCNTKSAGEKLQFRRLSREEQAVFMDDHAKDLKSEPVAVRVGAPGGRGATSTRGKRGAPGGQRDRQSKRSRGGDDESVTVAGQAFPNRQALKSRVYYLLRSTGAGTPLTGDNLAFAKALLGYHERAADKKRNMKTIVVDFHPKHKESLCLQVERIDGSREDFSWVKCVARVPLVSDKAVKINPGASINRRYAGHR